MDEQTEPTPEQQEQINLINSLGQLLYQINVDIVKARELYQVLLNPKKNVNHE